MENRLEGTRTEQGKYVNSHCSNYQLKRGGSSAECQDYRDIMRDYYFIDWTWGLRERRVKIINLCMCVEGVIVCLLGRQVVTK